MDKDSSVFINSYAQNHVTNVWSISVTLRLSHRSAVVINSFRGLAGCDNNDLMKSNYKISNVALTV